MKHVFHKSFFSGELATLKFTISSSDVETDTKIYDLFRVQSSKLKSTIDDLVESKSDGHIHIEKFSIEKGSAVITVVLATAGVAYYGISRYKNFIESIGLIYSQLRHFFGMVASVPLINTTISGSWQPSDDFATALESFGHTTTDLTQFLLLGYLVFSHLILLSVVVYIALMR